MELTRRFQDQLTALRPGWRGERGLVAYSGGLDSTALMHLAALSLAPGRLAAAHLNHRLRGPAAEADQAFARRAAEGLGLTFFTESQDVAARAQARGLGLEEAARTARYEFLRRAAEAWSADFILTGHQADDQAETLFWRLIKGSGAGGLAGIPPRRRLPLAEPGSAGALSPADNLVNQPTAAGNHFNQPPPAAPAPSTLPRTAEILRPLLPFPRAALKAWLESRGLTWVEDASNQDHRHLRNRLRGEMWPQLTALNPRLTEALGRTAVILREEEDFWELRITRLWAELAREEGPGRCRLSRAALLALSRAERRRLVYRALRAAQQARPRPGEPVSFESVETVLSLLPLPRHRGLDLPGGLRAAISGDDVLFSLASRFIE